MDKSETTEALAAVGMMLQAFPSAQSSITAESPRVYLFAVEEFSLEGIRRACRAIVRGEVKDLKADFPPSAPKLAQIVKEADDKLKVERFEAEHVFVAQDSELWEKIGAMRRDRNMLRRLSIRPDGREVYGWHFKPEEVEEARNFVLPPPIAPAELEAMHGRLRNLGFTVGDPEDAKDAA